VEPVDPQVRLQHGVNGIASRNSYPAPASTELQSDPSGDIPPRLSKRYRYRR